MESTKDDKVTNKNPPTPFSIADILSRTTPSETKNGESRQRPSWPAHWTSSAEEDNIDDDEADEEEEEEEEEEEVEEEEEEEEEEDDTVSIVSGSLAGSNDDVDHPLDMRAIHQSS